MTADTDAPRGPEDDAGPSQGTGDDAGTPRRTGDAGVEAAIKGGGGGMSFEATQTTGREVTFRIFRGENPVGTYEDYTIPEEPGMVVLDAVHRIQEKLAPDLACRWNCKAGKCGSCSAEINGIPRLMCMTRLSDILGVAESKGGEQSGGVGSATGGGGGFTQASSTQPITIAPLKAFPIIKDLVTDVSWNYEQNERITPFTPRPMTDKEKAKGEFNIQQQDVDRIQEFRKCIECYLCQDVCHVLRTHQKHDEFAGPRFMIRYASLEMHPADQADRLDDIWDKGGIGMCNITKCCTEVCPEHITITDNAIIPMKERVVAERFDPLKWLWRKITGKKRDKEAQRRKEAGLPMAKQ